MSGLTGNNILAGSSGQATGYNIDQSLRFNDDDGTYLSKAAPGAAGDLNNWTVSVWLKRGQTTGLLGGSWEYQFFGQGDASPNPVSSMSFSTYLSDANKLVVSLYGTSDSNLVCKWSSDAFYRDHSAWYHVVVKWDNTQSAAADILKVYVNGEVVSGTFGTSPSQGTTTVVNKNFKQFLGKYVYNTQPNWWDGYMAEYHFIDGQSLTAASFGETNSDTNQWVPIEYEGTHGTQGWYLNFSDSSSIGADSSGNGNNFTANVLTATDQVLDSPTNNFSTLNPLYRGDSKIGLEEGNLKANASGESSVDALCASTLSPSNSKWYCEFYCKTLPGSDRAAVGIADTDNLNVYTNGNSGNTVMIATANDNRYWDFGTEYDDATGVAQVVAGDIVQFAWDVDTGKVWIGINNTWQGASSPNPSTATSPLATHATVNSWIPIVRLSTGLTASNLEIYFNSGQDSSFAGNKTAQGNGGAGEDFYYTPPSGYKALNTNNLSNPSIADPTAHFNTVLYSGNSSTQSITGVGFQPNLSWTKVRNAADSHVFVDSVRGDKALRANSSIAEYTTGVSWQFDSDGFSMTGTTGELNYSGYNYAVWNWKAGGAAVSNTDGSITSSVSANPTAGFSIVSYTGNATTGATVGHGLSQAPEMLIVKQTDATKNWSVLANSDPTDYLTLNSNNTTSDDSSFWNDTNPSASVFTLGSIDWVNANTNTYIAYCFHSVDGYSKVGGYTGNGSTDGTFVYTGFKPSFILWKSTSAAENWQIQDNKVNPYNVVDKKFFANTTASEYTGAEVDFVSNGFKLRHSGGGGNGSSETLIYIAFAESPFKYSNAR